MKPKNDTSREGHDVMTRKRTKPNLVEREILAAIKFYMERGWSWASVVAFLADKAMWRPTP